MRGFISGLSILFHWSTFLFLCHHHTILMTVALQYSLKPGLWFLQLHFSFSGLLWLFEVLRISTRIKKQNKTQICSTSVKNAVGNLIGIALNLWIAFGSSHFDNTDSSNPRTWYICPSSSVCHLWFLLSASFICLKLWLVKKVLK